MKKALILSMVLVGALSLGVFAGPTFGIGTAWADGTVFVAPSVGMQYLPSRGLGVSTTMHIALLGVLGGVYPGFTTAGVCPQPDNPCPPPFAYQVGALGFWEIFTVTIPVFDLSGGIAKDPCVDGDCDPKVGQFKVLAGLGTPFGLVWTQNDIYLEGWGIGLTFGFAIEGVRGNGVKLLAYYNGYDSVGVGINTYFDLFGGRTRGIWNR